MFRSKSAPKSAVQTTPTRRKGAPGPVFPLSLLLAASGLTYLGWEYNNLHPDDRSFEVQRELIGNRINRFLAKAEEKPEKPREKRHPIHQQEVSLPRKAGQSAFRTWLDLNGDGNHSPEEEPVIQWSGIHGGRERPFNQRFLSLPIAEMAGWTPIHEDTQGYGSIRFADSSLASGYGTIESPNYLILRKGLGKDTRFLAVAVIDELPASHELSFAEFYTFQRYDKDPTISWKWVDLMPFERSYPKSSRLYIRQSALQPGVPFDVEAARKGYEERRRKEYDIRIPIGENEEPAGHQFSLDLDKDGTPEIITFNVFTPALFSVKSLTKDVQWMARSGPAQLWDWHKPYYGTVWREGLAEPLVMGVRLYEEFFPRLGTGIDREGKVILPGGVLNPFYEAKVMPFSAGEVFPGLPHGLTMLSDFRVFYHLPPPGNLVAGVSIDSKVQPPTIIPPAPETFVPAERKEEPKVEPEQKAEPKEPAKEPSRLFPEPLVPPPLLEAKDPCYQTNVSFGAAKEADFSVADGEAETFTLRKTNKGLTVDSLVDGQTQIARMGKGSKTKPAYAVYEMKRGDGSSGSSYILVAVRRKRGQSYDVESCFAVPEPTEGVVSGKVLGSTITYHPQSGEVVVVQPKKGKVMSTKTASPAETDSAPVLDLEHRLAHELFTVSPHGINYTEISRPLADFDVYIRDYDRVARRELGTKVYKQMKRRVQKLGDDYRTLTKEFFPTELKDPKTFTAKDMVEGFAVLSALRAKAETGDADARYYTYAHLSRHLLHIAQTAKEAGDMDVARSTGQEALNIDKSMLAEYGEQVRAHYIHTKTLVADLGIPELR